MRAKGVAITMAMTKLIGPVKPNSMESVAPSRPEMMPSGRPKLRPQPECTMGTIASTSTAFQLKRLMVLVICVAKSAPTSGAAMNRSSRNAAMIRRGRPKELPAAFTLSINVAFSPDNLLFILPPHFT